MVTNSWVHGCTQGRQNPICIRLLAHNSPLSLGPNIMRRHIARQDRKRRLSNSRDILQQILTQFHRGVAVVVSPAGGRAVVGTRGGGIGVFTAAKGAVALGFRAGGVLFVDVPVGEMEDVGEDSRGGADCEVYGTGFWEGEGS